MVVDVPEHRRALQVLTHTVPTALLNSNSSNQLILYQLPSAEFIVRLIIFFKAPLKHADSPHRMDPASVLVSPQSFLLPRGQKAGRDPLAETEQLVEGRSENGGGNHKIVMLHETENLPTPVSHLFAKGPQACTDSTIRTCLSWHALFDSIYLQFLDASPLQRKKN